MTKEKAHEITFTEPASFDEVVQICEEFKEVPMADVLVDVFLEHADPESFQTKEDNGDSEVLANSKGEGFSASLKISHHYGRVDLEIYDGSMDLIPSSGWVNAFCGTVAIFYAGQEKTGVWSAGKGDKQTFGITARVIPDLHLPSEQTKWMFEVFEDVARRTNERYVLRQPEFWPGEAIPEPERV